MPEIVHELKVAVEGETIRDWLSYDIRTSIVQPAGSFTLTVPWSAHLWRLLKNDRYVKITLDDAPLIAGFSSKRARTTAGRSITFSGYDKISRLIAESSPNVSFSGLSAAQLIGKLADPWFKEYELSNTNNRKVSRGRKGHRVRDSGRVFIDTRKGAGSHIEPGQFRYTAIAEIAKQMEALVWSSADGKTIIIGQPDYAQEVQYFFTPENALDIREEDTTDDRYSYYLVLGAGAGTDENYGHAVSSRFGEARDNPGKTGGEGKDFSRPKRLIISDRHDLSSRKEAVRRAEQERDRRDMKAKIVQIDFQGHGQTVKAGAGRTLFVPDTICDVRDPEADLVGKFLIVDVVHRATREAGEMSSLELLRSGTKLAL